MCPASPCNKIKRVVATANDKRNRVVSIKTEGKDENSIGEEI